MAKYQFTTPVGATYEVDAPDDMSEQDVYNQFIGQVQQYEDSANQDAANLDDQLARAQTAVSQAGERGQLTDTQSTAQAGTPSYLQTEQQSNPFIPNAVAEASASVTGRNPNDTQAQQKVDEDLQKKAREPFMDKAKELVGTSNYKGMTQSQIADALAQADYVKGASTGIASVATLPVSAGATLLGRIATGALIGGGSTLAGQAAESASLGENKFDAGELGTGATFGAGAGAAAPLVSGLIGRGVNAVRSAGEGIRNVLPRVLGGNTAEQAAANRIASSANQDYLNRVVQGGDTEAQTAFRTATTDEAGNSILTPTQVFNDTGRGARFRGAESRELNRTDSINQAKYDTQTSGSSFTRATDDLADNPIGSTGQSTLQRAAADAADDFRQTARNNYNTSKASAQSILDENNIKQIKLPNTKDVANGHIEADNSVGKVNLNTETRRTLNQFQNAKINSIDDLDQWKRTLSEKAAKAGRNGDRSSQTALRDTLDSLRNEADSTIQSINPAAGSLYRDADKFFREGIEDFGNKSVLGRIADRANPDTAPNILLRGQNAQYNTRQAAEALGSRLDNPSTAQTASNLSRGIGEEARRDAIQAATRNGDFNPNTYQRSLLNVQPQAEVATDLGRQASAAGATGARNEAGINQALRDAASTVRPQGTAAQTGVLGNVLDVASGIGGVVTGGPAGAIAGLATRGARKAWNSGMIDRLLNTNQRASRYIDFMSQPQNAQRVLDVIGNRRATDEEVLNVINYVAERAGRTAAANTATSDNGVIPQQSEDSTSTMPVNSGSTLPTQEATVDTSSLEDEGIVTESNPISKRNEALYKGLVNAETGSVSNPWIRTGAQDSSSNDPSSAYGPAQITGTLMRDMLTRYPQIFTDKERQYAERYLDQATVMLARPDDPVFGYGKPGVLGKTAEQRKLYESIAKKFIDVLDKKNGGDFQSIVRDWRGLEDDAYLSKVSDGVNQYLASNNQTGNQAAG